MELKNGYKMLYTDRVTNPLQPVHAVKTDGNKVQVTLTGNNGLPVVWSSLTQPVMYDDGDRLLYKCISGGVESKDNNVYLKDPDGNVVFGEAPVQAEEIPTVEVAPTVMVTNDEQVSKAVKKTTTRKKKATTTEE